MKLAWKVNIFIARGDKSNDRIVVTHYKAAKSLDATPESRFELMWEMKLTFDFEMKDLKKVDLRIPFLEYGQRFAAPKKKTLAKLQQTFNDEMDQSLLPTKAWTPRQDFVLRKEKRLQMRTIPSSYLANPIIHADLTLHVEGKNVGDDVSDVKISDGRKEAEKCVVDGTKEDAERKELREGATESILRHDIARSDMENEDGSWDIVSSLVFGA